MSSDKNFGLTFFCIFLILLVVDFGLTNNLNPYLLLLCVSFLSVSMLKPQLFEILNMLWFKLGQLLASIINPLVLAVIFFLVVTPIGLIVRLCGIDSLHLKRKPTQSYWLEVDPQEKSMKDQF